MIIAKRQCIWGTYKCIVTKGAGAASLTDHHLIKMHFIDSSTIIAIIIIIVDDVVAVMIVVVVISNPRNTCADHREETVHIGFT